MEKLITAGDALAEILTRKLTMREPEIAAYLEALRQWNEVKERARHDH